MWSGFADRWIHQAREWDPEHIESIMGENHLGDFASRVEEGPHLALPHLLSGDFSTRSAPLDPLFVLHHTNLDRLYWQWQRRTWALRSVKYSGKKTESDDSASARSDDLLVFGDVGPSVRVRGTLNTESGYLCYSY